MRTDELLAAAVSLKRLDLRSSRLPVEAVLEFMDVQEHTTKYEKYEII